MISLNISYNGVKRKITVSDRTLVQAIITRGAEEFKIPMEKCSLLHKKTVLNPSMPLNLCGFSNNAMLDLMCNSSSLLVSQNNPDTINQSQLVKPCKIALTAIDTSNRYAQTAVVIEIKENLTLLQIINEAIAFHNLKIPLNIMEYNPQLNYLRSNFVTSQLSSESILSLGLSGQSVRMRLTYNCNSISDISSPSSAPAIVFIDPDAENSSKQEQSSPKSPLVQVSQRADSPMISEPSSPLPIQTNQAQTSIQTDYSMINSSSQENSPTLQSQTQNQSQSESVQSQPRPLESTLQIQAPQSEFEPISQSMEVECDQISSEQEKELLNLSYISDIQNEILSSNYDGDIKKFINIFSKYIFNLKKTSNISKFYFINLNNKVFLSNITSLKNYHNILNRLGFKEYTTDANFLVFNPFQLEKNFQLMPNESFCLYGLTDNEKTFINNVIILIENIYTELNIPYNERANFSGLDFFSNSNSPSGQSSSSPLTTPPVLEFDPFKSITVRTNTSFSDPVAKTGKQVTTTESKLKVLMNKKKTMEGPRSNVKRNTYILLPNSNYNNLVEKKLLNFYNDKTNSDSSPTSGSSKNEEEGSFQYINKDFLSSFMLNGENNTPLTTQAYRDLKKYETLKIYSKGIIRIRMPDGAQIVGNFHPSHTLADLYVWIFDLLAIHVNEKSKTDLELDYSDSNCINSYLNHANKTASIVRSNLNNLSKIEKLLLAISLFELYTSPPRTSYSPLPILTEKKSSLTNSNSNSNQFDQKDAEISYKGLVNKLNEVRSQENTTELMDSIFSTENFQDPSGLDENEWALEEKFLRKYSPSLSELDFIPSMIINLSWINGTNPASTKIFSIAQSNYLSSDHIISTIQQNSYNIKNNPSSQSYIDEEILDISKKLSINSFLYTLPGSMPIKNAPAPAPSPALTSFNEEDKQPEKKKVFKMPSWFKK